MRLSRAIPRGIGVAYRTFPGARAPEGAKIVAQGEEEAARAEEEEDASDRLDLRRSTRKSVVSPARMSPARSCLNPQTSRPAAYAPQEIATKASPPGKIESSRQRKASNATCAEIR